MPKRYEVLERSFINGRLYEPGETLVLEIDSPGGNLKLVGGDKSAGGSPTGNPNTDGPEYSGKHNGGGRFIIVNKAGERVGEFTGAREDAEAEAARLNAGGEITPTTGNPNTDGDNTGGNGLPDA
ncbi:hypothetical protein PspS35_19285 [Pseudomonas sp. S35]|uniref:hypothetical protein n=1 Tax=Pseudomonas sp. S35 TaxID=1573719 RepID=UPI00132EEF44|nr:hypothetical protein [Pseudomonas sp. S35]QHF45831.1 hypothetical protein PspS35_19285 [Pseudomonas sp. S35]